MKKTFQPNIRPIDRFTPKEIKVLADLEDNSFSEYDEFVGMRVRVGNGSPLSCKDIQDLFTEDKCRGFVIEDGDKLRGYLIYEPDGESYRVRRLLVHKEHRGLGWGKTLLDFLFEKATLYNKTKIIAVVSEAYLSAVAFLAHEGFSTKLIQDKCKSDKIECSHGVEEILT